MDTRSMSEAGSGDKGGAVDMRQLATQIMEIPSATEAERAMAAYILSASVPRYANVSCSQCGRDFGPGNHGFSHCSDHTEQAVLAPQSHGRPIHPALQMAAGNHFIGVFDSTGKMIAADADVYAPPSSTERVFNPVHWARKIRGCESEVAAQLALEQAVEVARSASAPITPAQIIEWADGIKAAFGTEFASRITPTEAALAYSIRNAIDTVERGAKP